MRIRKNLDKSSSDVPDPEKANSRVVVLVLLLVVVEWLLVILANKGQTSKDAHKAGVELSPHSLLVAVYWRTEANIKPK